MWRMVISLQQSREVGQDVGGSTNDRKFFCFYAFIKLLIPFMIGIRVFAWLCHVESCIAMCRFFPCRHCRLWFGVLFTVSTTSVYSADVSAVQRQVRYFCVQTSQTESNRYSVHWHILVNWQTSMILQQLCKFQCDSRSALLLQIWISDKESLAKMGACCSKFDGEIIWGGWKLTKPFSLMFYDVL